MLLDIDEISRRLHRQPLDDIKAVVLAKRFVEELEAITDGGTELFPFELIDELKEEYLYNCKEEGEY